MRYVSQADFSEIDHIRDEYFKHEDRTVHSFLVTADLLSKLVVKGKRPGRDISANYKDLRK